MIARTIFRLNVWLNGQSCLFQLRWGQEPELSADLEYHLELTTHYQNWRQLYEQCYYLKLRARPLSSGGVNPSTGDLHHQLEQARKKLLEAFQKWLSPLREIREKIRDQTHPAAQKSGESGETAVSYQSVDIFLACNSDTLSKLPWEAWELAPEGAPAGTIRLARIPMQAKEKTLQFAQERLRKKTRILVILGDDTGLDFDNDRNAVELLKNLAQVELFDWQHRDTTKLKTELAAKIEDEQGWNALFFVGHSDEKTSDGEFAIAPDTILTIKEIEKPLTTAKKQGLQFCLFNSCSGLKIANSLANLGLQAVVMREKIHNDVAHVFLQEFCQHLKQQKDVHDAMLAARKRLFEEKLVYPSAYLIPSFFSPYGAEPFLLEPFGWKPRLRQWLPTRGEVLALGIVLLLSSLTSVQDFFLDCRTLVQSIYRARTSQLQHDISPPVFLIAIDQESINRASAEIENFKTKPMDRGYLAKLTTRLSELKAKVIGIDYLLHTQEPREKELAKSIQSAVNQQNTWFVFAVSEDDKWKVTPKIASPNWSFQGDINSQSGAWDVDLPADATCTEQCPFAYLLALAHTLNRQLPPVSLPQPQLQSKANFQQEVSHYLNQGNGHDKMIASLKRAYLPFGLRSIIDFSIPPEQAYKRIPAWEFLSLPKSSLQQMLKQQVVIIAPGGYTDAEDNFSVPLAVHYWWCDFPNERQQKKADCPQKFTGGESHAYTVHHLLSQHRVALISDLWMIGIAAFLGKGTTLMLLKQKRQQRQQSAFVLVGATAVYGIVGLQVYISASVSIPWLLPSMFWIYCILLILRDKSYA